MTRRRFGTQPSHTDASPRRTPVSDLSSIEWTDATWNPVTGCTKVSEGCDHCYAETFAERWRGVPGHHFEHGFDVRLWPDRLTIPLTWRKPRRIFVNSMSDLFHPQISDEFIAEVFAVMISAPRHTFQLLTKRPGRMRHLLACRDFAISAYKVAISRYDTEVRAGWPLPNVWLGVSAETQKWADIRVPVLLDTPAAVRFVSAEPLLGPVNLAVAPEALGGLDWIDLLDWVIVGGESGPRARPMHPEWVRDLRAQCGLARTAFFFKQWGNWTPTPTPTPGPGRIAWIGADGTCDHPDAPGGCWMRQTTKKDAGRILDGRTWDQFPTLPTTIRA
jgi:protein gp37